SARPWSGSGVSSPRSRSTRTGREPSSATSSGDPAREALRASRPGRNDQRREGVRARPGRPRAHPGGDRGDAGPDVPRTRPRRRDEPVARRARPAHPRPSRTHPRLPPRDPARGRGGAARDLRLPAPPRGGVRLPQAVPRPRDPGGRGRGLRPGPRLRRRRPPKRRRDGATGRGDHHPAPDGTRTAGDRARRGRVRRPRGGRPPSRGRRHREARPRGSDRVNTEWVRSYLLEISETARRATEACADEVAAAVELVVNAILDGGKIL